MLGPALGLAGWAAAFTTVGAQLIYLGVALSIAGWGVRPTRATLAFALLGLFIEIGWILILSALNRLF